MLAGRSFYDFISEQDEGLVRTWINNIKGSRTDTGVNADTGFGYGRFQLCPQGRTSQYVLFRFATLAGI